MPIPNLLTKLIVNINKLSYDRQEELLRISEEWLNPEQAEQTEQTEQSSSSTDIGTSKKEPPSKVTRITIEDGDEGQEPEITLFEERAYERKRLMVPIEFVGGGTLFKEVTKDVGPGGVFIKTSKKDKFEIGQKVSMVFLLNDDNKPFKLSGTIVRIQDDGIAVQFKNISAFECIAIEEELNSMDDSSNLS